jgi:hypothetical protein
MSTENILTARKMGRYGRGRAGRIRAKRASLDRVRVAELGSRNAVSDSLELPELFEQKKAHSREWAGDFRELGSVGTLFIS